MFNWRIIFYNIVMVSTIHQYKWVIIIYIYRRRQWHPTPVLLPGKSHGWRSLVGYSPWGRWYRHDWVTSLSLFTFMHWRRKWQPTPVFLPGESQGLRSLVGFRLWGRTESDMTERLHFHFSLSCIGEGNSNPLQCSGLEIPRDRGAWWAAVYGVAESQTWSMRLSSSSSSSICICPTNPIGQTFSQPNLVRNLTNWFKICV